MKGKFLFGIMLTISIMCIISPVLASAPISFQADTIYIVDTINLSSQSHLVKVINIQNLLNTSINIELISDNPKIELPLSSITIGPNSSASVTIIISSVDSGIINGNICITKDLEELIIPVIVSVVASEEVIEEKILSVFPTGKVISITQGAATTVLVTITNTGTSAVELSADISGGTVTVEGINKPVSIKEFSSGPLESGAKRTLTVKVDAVDVPVGKYISKVLLEYAPGKSIELPFEVTVEKSVVPVAEVNKTMLLNVYPSTPEVDSLVYLSVTDTEDSIIPSSILIRHDDCYGNRIEEFSYKFPFNLESGNYTLTATSEGYASSIEYINVAELSTKLEVPNNPTTDSKISIRYLTDNNILIDTGDIVVNNESYTGGLASVYLDEGTYTITANAPGFIEQTKELTVTKTLKIIIQNATLEPNQNQIIRFNKNCSWELRTEGMALDYGSGDKFVFKQENAGIYDIYVGDKKLGVISVESKEWNFDMLGLSGYWWIIILVIGIILIAKRKSLPNLKRKKGPRVGYESYHSGPVKDIAGIKDKE